MLIACALQVTLDDDVIWRAWRGGPFAVATSHLSTLWSMWDLSSSAHPNSCQSSVDGVTCGAGRPLADRAAILIVIAAA